MEWRETDLVERYWPGTTSLSGQTILGDDVVEKLATCGERIESYPELRRHVRWAIGHDNETGKGTAYGEQLLAKLSQIYSKLDQKADAARQQQLALCSRSQSSVTTTNFYATSSSHGTSQRIVDHEEGSRSNTEVSTTGRRPVRSQRGRPHWR